MYIFKHALLQETAYQSLLKRTRQQYHQRIAQVLEEGFPEIVAAQPELLAQHYTEAGLSAQAISYWQRAGQQAIQRSAYPEAISLLTRELQVLHILPETSERDCQELDVQITLGQALSATKGHAAPEVIQAYTRARALCEQVGETTQRFAVLGGLRTLYEQRGELTKARDLAEQLLRLAQSTDDLARLERAYTVLGQTLFFLVEFVLARASLERAMALYDPAGDRCDEAELHHIKGELLLRQTVADASQAETCFQQALAVARRQQAKSWELRATVSLSRLWQKQGKRAEARELLAPIYGWFTEGFDTADLQEARALLEALS
jgi:predicted ATPase